jgi:hypothetical protein
MPFGLTGSRSARCLHHRPELSDHQLTLIGDVVTGRHDHLLAGRLSTSQRRRDLTLFFSSSTKALTPPETAESEIAAKRPAAR